MKIKEAEDHIKPSGLPVRCSSCFGQYPSRKHVDFGAACDRGFYGDDAATPITMDDLVLCDSCIGEAARIIGWAPTSEVKDTLAHQESTISRLERELKQQRDYADRMEDALMKRREPVKLDHRQKPRPLREPVNG